MAPPRPPPATTPTAPLSVPTAPSMVLFLSRRRSTCLQLVLVVVLSLTFKDSYANESDPELCNASRRNQTSCNNEVDVALGDDRIRGKKPNQCRVACQFFSHPQIAMTIRPAPCSFNLCDVEQPFRTFDFGTRMCQPRAVCIAACGEEPPGCVYSGTCREFTCFHDKNNANPANFTRITFAGPRTIVRVNDSQTADTSASPDAVLTSRDLCSDTHHLLYDSECEPSDNVFLSELQSRSNPTQCRALCRAVENPHVEIVRMRTSCGFCRSANVTHQCFRQSVCEQECAQSYTNVSGCVFTGSCQSLICVSAIDSKLPAEIDVSDDSGRNAMIVSVDNEPLPITVDPPVFAKFLEHTKIPNIRIPDIATSTSTNDDDSQSGEPMSDQSLDANSDEGQPSKWVWLGPIIGLIGTILTAGVALVAALISRRTYIFDSRTSTSKKEQHFDTLI